MSHVESEILLRVTHLDKDQQSAVLDYIRHLNGKRHSAKKHRKTAMRQIRQALGRFD